MNLSYSMQVPFPFAQATSEGFRFDSSLSADFVVGADLNPGEFNNAAGVIATPAELIALTSGSVADQRAYNSRNHDREGQNVLYADGRVEWQNTSACGMLRKEPGAGLTARWNDRIYWNDGGLSNNGEDGAPAPDNTARPFSSRDTILMPTATYDNTYPAP
jgi:hypothetical protein